jgi:tryptophan synthase alpha chain
MADGPIVQLSGQRALKAGATLAGIIDMVREFRRGDDATPLILMGYLNPILSYGAAEFCADARAAGADGLIVVDMPPEESQDLAPFATGQGLDLIRLVAPTTDDARLPGVLRACSGFIYYVAITGITGTRSATTADLALNIPRIRKHTDLPIAIGFGVRTPAQAAEAARMADGAVVASALIQTLAGTLTPQGQAVAQTAEAVLKDVRALAHAIRATELASTQI